MRSYTRPTIRGRPDMGWKAHATWHGLSSPWVWDGPYAPSSAHRPQPSAVRLPPSAVPSDSCAFCASLRPTLRCPSSVVRRPSSAVSRPIRFLRLLRVFAANPPAAVRHLSSAVCRPPSGTGLISFPSSFVSYLAPVTHSGCALGPQRCFRLRAACLRRACLTEAQKRPPWFRLVRGHEGSAE